MKSDNKPFIEGSIFIVRVKKSIKIKLFYKLLKTLKKFSL